MFEELWFAFGVDPLNTRFMVLGVGETRAKAEAGFAEADDDIVYRRAFNCLSKTLRSDLDAWLKGCGVVEEDRQQIMRDFAKQLGEMLGEMKDEPGKADDPDR